MTPFTRRLVITVSLCAGLATLAEAAPQAPTPGTTGAPGLPPRAPSAPPTSAKGTAVISGRILAADTGLPIRRARVIVQGNAPNIPTGPAGARTAITDADGAFVFTELPAGRYHLQASKARYVDAQYGARRPSSSGRPIELADGQKVENITVSLSPAGAIVGRVLDELGEPVAGAQVMPLRSTNSIKGPELMPWGNSDTTDDIGTYRLHGLQPGTYYVSAQGDDPVNYGIATASAATGFAPTYFPNTAVAAEAQPIEVVAGGEAVADIALVPTRLSPVSGVVVNAAGAFATGGYIGARASNGMMRFGGPGSGGEIKPDGSFALSGLAPGEYTIQARPTFEPRGPFPSPTQMVMSRRTASTSIVVNGEPITGLRLVLADPIRIPVVATFEDATGRPPDQVSISAFSEKMDASDSATRGADGRLTLEIAPGPWRFSAFASGPWIVKRFTYRGDELDGREDVEVTDEPGNRLEVVFTTKTGTLTGSVKDASGRPVAEYIVFIVPENDDHSSPSGGWNVSTARPDQAGRFKAERLRPGTYVATAIEEPDQSPGRNFKERLGKAGTSFRVRENETVTLDLTLVSLPDQEP
jgi:hypothetical protein